MINGRLPCAAGARPGAPLLPVSRGVVRAKRLLTPAAALPASEVKKNLRRDHKSIAPPVSAAANIQLEVGSWKFEVRGKRLGEDDAFRRAGLLDGVVMSPPLLPGISVVAQGFAGDQAERAVDPAASVGIERVVVEKIEQIGNSAEALF